MSCFYPLSAWQLGDGNVVFVEQGDVRRALQLPCGQCIGCRIDRSRQWAVRCVHESSLFEHSCFVTLTYDDDHLERMSLHYRDFQLFMKRMKRKDSFARVRFFMCGEYGEENFRPHFHAMLFGAFFSDREYFRSLPSGSRIYTSKELAGLWPHGFSSIGDVTLESAAYVARYAAKSALSGHDGKRRDVTQGFVDAETGEYMPFVPEFCRMSLKPGIGAMWYETYGKEVFPRDAVRVNGAEMKVPKYYDRLQERADAFAREYTVFLRGQRAAAASGDNTRERLNVREAVMKARLSFKKRGLK